MRKSVPLGHIEMIDGNFWRRWLPAEKTCN